MNTSRTKPTRGWLSLAACTMTHWWINISEGRQKVEKEFSLVLLIQSIDRHLEKNSGALERDIE